MVKSGKVFGWTMAITTMIIAPLLAGQDSLFGYLQKMNAIYFIPILAVVLVGLLTKRVPPMAAKVALVGGCLLIAAGYFVPPFNKLPIVMHEFHFVAAVFVLLVAVMLVIGKLRPALRTGCRKTPAMSISPRGKARCLPVSCWWFWW
ncbi:hypothetical protein HAALTHF_16660n [Vreelandella aquamarina]|nr:hypothetical protein HAALTHF_16660n [Halomonas axialensis]